MDKLVSQFKINLFGTDEIILHTADIVRNKNGFESLKDALCRQRFYRELNQLMQTLDYQVVACVIRKDLHLQQYGIAALDPYSLSLGILLERFYFETSEANQGLVIAEKRGDHLDKQLSFTWNALQERGTPTVKGADFKKRIPEVITRSKYENISGLQLADLVVSPVGRHILGKPDQEDYKILETKYCRSQTGDPIGFGLVTLPKN